MAIQVREKNQQELIEKLKTIETPLSKLAYLESALKENFDLETKRFIWQNIADLYEEKGMYEKAAKAMASKSVMEVTFREKIESSLKAAELYSKAGKIEDAEQMFLRASREANTEEIARITLAKKNIYTISAQELEKKGKKATALKFYEQLIKMPLEENEKNHFKKKLLEEYKALGKFREARLMEGI